MSSGVWVLIAAVVMAVGLGAYRAYADGRFRGTHPVPGASASEAPGSSRRATPSAEIVEVLPAGRTLGERATLLQFSSAFCAPCRVARRTLADVAAIVPGVVHVEIDAESHLDLVRRLGIVRTPTTLVLDAAGAEVARATGAPTRDQVIAQLGAVA